MLSIDDINSLGSLLDTTFHSDRSSSQGFRISAKLVEGRLVVKYITTQNLISEPSGQREQVNQMREVSLKLLASFTKELKSEFKKKTGNVLTLKERHRRDNIEYIGSIVSGLFRRVYFYHDVSFEIR